MTTAEIMKWTHGEYLADPCDTPSLSSGIAHTLLRRSPAHAWLEHPRLGGKGRRSTGEMDRGSLAHTMLLGKGKELAVVEAKDWRTKVAKAARDEARKQGKIAMLARQHDELVTATTAIRKELARYVSFDGMSEVPIVWEEESAQGPVVCRAMLDHLHFVRGQILDVKTCESAHPDACMSHAINYGYLIQSAAYVAAVEALRPELAGHIDYVLLFCELEPPYAVLPARFDGGLREIGRMHWRRAIDLWSRCLGSRRWPGYASEIVTLNAPSWLLSRELGEEMAAAS